MRRITTAALIHRTTGPHAYPLGEAQLRVMLQAARGELSGVACIYNDRYRDERSNQTTELVRAGSDDRYDYWVGALDLPARRAKYRFQLNGGAGEAIWLGESGVAPASDPNACAPFHYSYINPADQVWLPAWLSGATLYSIFVDRFARAQPAVTPPGAEPWGTEPTWYIRMGGDLAGIESKLEWLRALAVGCIWLTPVFDSPSCHRYDTRDYYKVEPTLGTESDLRRLIQSAHAKEMRVLLDGVFNHSGQEFFAFQDVIAHGPRSAYWHWYNVHADRVEIGPGLRCNYESFAENVPTMPKLMTQHPDVAAYFHAVAEHWIRQVDADGWRLDVANEVDHQFWREFRRQVKQAKSDALILGEVWVDALTWLQGDQYDSVMHYPWRDAVVAYLTGRMDAPAFDQALTRLRFAYPGHAVGGLVHLISSHDIQRIRSAVGGSPARARIAAVLLMTAQGVPMIYYGDEVGMAGSWDPENRRCMSWEDADHDRETLALYRRLGQLRRRLPWLNLGEWRTLLADRASGLFVYRRSGALALNAAPAGLATGPADEQVWVVLNPGTEQQSLRLGGRDGLEGLEGAAVDLLDPALPTLESEALQLPPGGYTVLGSQAVRDRLRVELSRTTA